MTTFANEPEAARPSSAQHGFRISLNLTRRVVRRVIELEEILQLHSPRVFMQMRVSNVPDAVSFQFSLRVLRRVVHRLIEQAERDPCRVRPA